MSLPARVVILAHPDDTVAARLARVSGAALVHRGRELVGSAGATLVHVRAPARQLDRLAVACTLAGFAACLCAPTDSSPPPALPRLHRRWHRFVFGSQAEARAWRGLLPLGRLHVVDAGASDTDLSADLTAVWEESIRMAGR